MRTMLMKPRSFLTRRRVFLLFVFGVASLLVFGLIGEVRPYFHELQKTTRGPVFVTVDNARLCGSDVCVTYSMTNNTSASILVFDQMVGPRYPDQKHPYGEPDSAWVFVDIQPDGWSFSGRAYKAILSRRIEHVGTFVCDSPMPYGRVLGAGETLRRSLSVPLPLKENSARFAGSEPRSKDKPFAQMVDLREVEVQIGWSAELPEDPSADKQLMTTFSAENQTLWYFTPGRYYWLEPLQQIATSSTKPVRWNGLLY